MAESRSEHWLRVVVPRDNTSAPFTAEQLYAAIHAGTGKRQRTQILLTGTPGDVGIWIRTEPERLSPVGAMVHATYPDAELEPGRPPLPNDAQPRSLVAARWGLAAEAAYPIKTVRAFEHSEPMAMTLGALSGAGEGECGAVSLVLSPAPPAFARRSLVLARALASGADTAPWWQRAVAFPVELAAELLTSLAAGPDGADAGPPRLLADPDLDARLKWITGKAAQPAFRVTLRTAWLSPTPSGAQRGHAALASALGQFAVVGQNAFVPVHEDAVQTWRGITHGTPRRRDRCVLAIDELAGLVHLPGKDLVVPYLRRTGARRRELRVPAPPGALHLADAVHRDAVRPIGTTVSSLMTHAYVVGPSGTGKTTLLARLVLELLGTGTAAIVLDPHGDLTRQVLARMPALYADRVQLMDLADPARLPTINPLWIPPGPPGSAAVARAVRSAAVTAVFADLWGLHRAATPNLLHFLEAALAALVAAGNGCLAQLPRFLTETDWRWQIINAGGDSRIRARWTEFGKLNHDDQSRTIRAILNKAADFDRNPLLGAVFGDPGPGLRVDEAMDSGRILLVSLPRGLVPEGTVELIGSVLVSLVYQAALAREARPETDRPPVVAVIDEFQEFALTTFAKAVTATRKYGLGLVVANQNLSRLAAVSPDVLSTLLANVATLVSFRTGPADAEVLAPYFPPFAADDLTALAPYECYWRFPAPAGPAVVSARTRPLPGVVRDDAEVNRFAARLRVGDASVLASAAAHGDAEPDGTSWC